MKLPSIASVHEHMEYPGRFLIAEVRTDAVILIYGVTARSDASKAKRYIYDVQTQTVSVHPTDADVMAQGDLTLLDYTALRIFENGCVLGNGRQVDSIARLDEANARSQLDRDLATQTYEHDKYATPRITACTVLSPKQEMTTALHRIRKGEGKDAIHESFDINNDEHAYFMSTYAGPNVRPTPSATVVPIQIASLPKDLDDCVRLVYESFAPKDNKEDLRVSVVGCLVRYDGTNTISILNSVDDVL